MKKIALVLSLLVGSMAMIHAQGTAFGLKSGLSVGTQNWSSFGNNSPLFKPHYLFSIESLDVEDRFSFYLETGYHTRGTAYRFVGSSPGFSFQNVSRNIEFRNISLSGGLKSKKDFKNNMKSYVLFALRGEYTSGVNFEVFEIFEPGTRPFVYGITAGAGFEWAFTEHVGGVIEFRVSPDIARQIFVPSYQGLTDGFTGEVYNTREQNVRNVSFELSVGLRFLRKVVYLD
jgi:hypothetical protein